MSAVRSSTTTTHALFLHGTKMEKGYLITMRTRTGKKEDQDWEFSGAERGFMKLHTEGDCVYAEGIYFSRYGDYREGIKPE